MRGRFEHLESSLIPTKNPWSSSGMKLLPIHYVSALKEAGHEGFYTIEREVGENSVDDIIKAVKFLQKY